MISKHLQWAVSAIAALICTVTLSIAVLDNDAQAKPPAKTKTAAAWKVGDKVSAVWPTDGKWYNARILEIYDTGLYHVRYDDDGIERKDIQADQIRARKARASTGGGGGGGGASPASCPGPGLTRRCGGTCVNIQTDDNNCGSCGNRCSAGKHCDGHMFCRDASGNL
jgi:hypothetical protein